VTGSVLTEERPPIHIQHVVRSRLRLVTLTATLYPALTLTLTLTLLRLSRGDVDIERLRLIIVQEVIQWIASLTVSVPFIIRVHITGGGLVTRDYSLVVSKPIVVSLLQHVASIAIRFAWAAAASLLIQTIWWFGV
jgi:hypothetical protein